MDLIILAGGMGSRFGGIKQAQPINKHDEFIIDYSVYDAMQFGFDRVILIIKPEHHEIFKNTVEARFGDKIKVEYVFQTPDISLCKNFEGKREKPFGTGQALLLCKDIAQDKFAIINADDFYGRESFALCADFLKETNDEWSIVVYPAKNTLSPSVKCKRGVCKIKDGNFCGVIESHIDTDGTNITAQEIRHPENIRNITDEDLCNMNMFCFSHSIFDHLQEEWQKFESALTQEEFLTAEFSLPEVLTTLIEEQDKKVKVLKTTSKWIGITYPSDIDWARAELDKLTLSNVYPEKLW